MNRETQNELRVGSDITHVSLGASSDFSSFEALQLDKALQYCQSDSSSAGQLPVGAIPGDKQCLKQQINRGRRLQCGNASISLVPNLSLFKSLCTTFYFPSVPCHCIASCKSDHGDKSIRE